MNTNWPRWIFASVSKHFDDNRQGLTMYVEGTPRNTRTTEDFIELRIDGPWVTELNRGNFKVYIEINILIQSTMDDADFHKIHRNAGIVSVAFTDLPIYKYGNGPSDDDSLLGCLHLIQDAAGQRQNLLQISHFGQIDQNIRLQQATVEGHYKGFLET